MSLDFYLLSYRHLTILTRHLFCFKRALEVLMCLSGSYLLFDTVWYWHILHWNYLCKFTQAVYILDFLTEFGAVKRSRKCQNQKLSEISINEIDIEITSNTNLMKGFVSASRVRINQEGWTIIKDFKFFLNLHKKNERSCNIFNHIPHMAMLLLGLGWCLCNSCKNYHLDSPSINLLVTLSEPANSWHLFPRGRPIQIHNHIVLSNQKLQCANDIPTTGKPISAGYKILGSQGQRDSNKHSLE